MIVEQLHELMEKEVDRKEFLAHIGLGLLTLVGVSGILKTLNATNNPQSSPKIASNSLPQSNGYGSSPYGK